MNLPIKSTVRLRLTLLFGTLFLLAGVVLLGLTYGLVRETVNPGPPTRREIIEDRRETRSPGDFVFGEDGRTDDGRTVNQVIRDVRWEERMAALDTLLTRSALALALVGGGAILLGWMMAGRTLRPIAEITGHAQRASQATLGDRLNMTGPDDELKELADTFDAMLARLQAAFESQRHFAAQASHELRTPLAIMRAEADVALAEPNATERERQLAGAIRTEVDRSERLVAGLLTLAKAESTMSDRERINLADLVGDVAGDHSRAADSAGVLLELELNDATVTGDQALLRHMVGNLIDNAIRYNVPQGWLKVAVGVVGNAPFVRVENNGPQVRQEDIEELFEAFRQGTTRKGGHGLGLSIVRAVANAHGGTVEAAPGAEGGMRITVSLPPDRA